MENNISNLAVGKHTLLNIPAGQRKIVSLAVGTIKDNPYQPRTIVNKAGVKELAASIEQEGLLEPILVATDPEERGQYILAAGQRRLLATKSLRRSAIEAIIVPFDRLAEIALIENLQREDLTPIEEAEALNNLMKLEVSGLKKYKTQADVAKAVGMSRINVTKLLRLNTLPNAIKAQAKSPDNKVAKSVLMELAMMDDSKKQLSLWAQLQDGGDNVHKVRRAKEGKPANQQQITPLDRVEKTADSLVKSIEKLGKVSSQDAKTRLVEIHHAINKAMKSVQ